MQACIHDTKVRRLAEMGDAARLLEARPSMLARGRNWVTIVCVNSGHRQAYVCVASVCVCEGLL